MANYDFESAKARMRELGAKLADMKADDENLSATEREYNNIKREFDAQVSMLNAANAKKAQPREKKTLVGQIREAMDKNLRSITVQGYTPEGGSPVAGVHNHVVEEEIQGILDPLYTNSALAELGVRFYPGLVQGDVKIPVMGKNSVAWESEIGAADATGNSFTSVTLKPKRLSAYVDISKQLILQDTIGVEAAVKRDLTKAIMDKLEATIFGYAQGTTTQPGGLFYNQSLEDANTFAKVVAIEGGLEDACVNLANCKYLLSPKAKATLRTMATNGNGSPRALNGGAIDGTPVVVSANVIDSSASTKGAYIFGDFSNIAVGSWGDVEITVDPYTQAANGCIRLVVNAYFDAQVLRSAAFAYGDVRHA